MLYLKTTKSAKIAVIPPVDVQPQAVETLSRPTSWIRRCRTTMEHNSIDLTLLCFTQVLHMHIRLGQKHLHNGDNVGLMLEVLGA